MQVDGVDVVVGGGVVFRMPGGLYSTDGKVIQVEKDALLVQAQQYKVEVTPERISRYMAPAEYERFVSGKPGPIK